MANIKLHIKSGADSRTPVEVDGGCTVAELKQAVEAALADTATPAPASSQKLIYAGKILKDSEPLTAYKIGDGHTIHLIRGASTAGASASATPAASGSTPAANDATADSAGSAQMPPLPGPFSNPLLGLLAGGLGGAAGNPAAAAGGAAPPATGLPNAGDPQFGASMAQLFSNPALMQMVSTMLPPQLAQTLQSPQMQAMLSNPALMQMAMQMMNSQQSPVGAASAGTASPGAASPGAGAGPNPNAMAQMMQMLMGGMFAGAGAPGSVPTSAAAAPASPAAASAAGSTPTAAAVPPEQLYETQLRQLQEMGFYNAAQNIQALQMFSGSVEAALEHLFSQPRI